MYYILKSQQPTKLQEEFCNLLIKGFRFNGRDLKIFNGQNLTVEDVLIVTWYRDLTEDWIINSPCKKVTHQHATACLTNDSMNDIELEKWYLNRKDYIVISNSNACKRAMVKILGKIAEKIGVAGFPLDFSSYLKFDTKKDSKLVVVGDRLADDKQFALSLHFMEKLVELGYKCIFSTPINQRDKVNGAWIYHYKERGIEIQFNTKQDFLKLLSKAEFYFTCSLPETLGISVVEAIHYGCNVLVPNGDNSYLELLEDGYMPYSYDSLKDKIVNNTKIKSNISWLDYKEVSKKYIEIIENYDK